jgi:pilus assembly protein Flp/PilA
VSGATQWLYDLVRRSRGNDRGAALIEYAFLVALIAIVCLVAVGFFGTSTSHSFSSAGSHVVAAG